MKIKGTSLVVVSKLIRKKFGEEGLEKWLNSLEPEARRVYSKDILPYRWYDLKKHYLEGVKKYCDLFYGGDFEGAREMGRFDAEDSLRGVYRWFIQLGSPNFLVKRASTVFPTYYKNAIMEVVESGSGRATVRISKFGTMNKINEYTIIGWIQRAMEISGAKNVRIRVQRGGRDGEAHIDFVVRWEEK